MTTAEEFVRQKRDRMREHELENKVDKLLIGRGVTGAGKALSHMTQLTLVEKMRFVERHARHNTNSYERLVEHCGWLLKMGRAVHNWRMRWVLLQAGYLWYFKDGTCKEPLGRMVRAARR